MLFSLDTSLLPHRSPIGQSAPIAAASQEAYNAQAASQQAGGVRILQVDLAFPIKTTVNSVYKDNALRKVGCNPEPEQQVYGVIS